MDTLNMFEEAQKQKLTKYQLTAHIFWALVSQTGRQSLAVGEITKLVQLTSGIRPSTYQVKAVIEEFSCSMAVQWIEGPNRGKGKERLYKADVEAIAILTAYMHGLLNTGVYEFACDLVEGVQRATRKAFYQMERYNESIDNPTVVVNDD